MQSLLKRMLREIRQRRWRLSTDLTLGILPYILPIAALYMPFKRSFQWISLIVLCCGLLYRVYRSVALALVSDGLLSGVGWLTRMGLIVFDAALKNIAKRQRVRNVMALKAIAIYFLNALLLAYSAVGFWTFFLCLYAQPYGVATKSSMMVAISHMMPGLNAPPFITVHLRWVYEAGMAATDFLMFVVYAGPASANFSSLCVGHLKANKRED